MIHWNIGEAERRAETLRRAGHEVTAGPFQSGGFASLRADPPDAVVIDLTRLPAQGRDVALGLRTMKATRLVPLVLVAGDPRKVARIVELLPDAVYTTWRGIGGAIRRAIAQPPVDPVVPQSNFAGYSATPLTKKLGIKPGATVILVAAPDDFQRTLGKLPEGVTLRRRAAGGNELVIWFVRSRRDLQKRIARLGELAGPGGLWICWPKKSSGVKSDLTQPVVREVGLASGLVDYKICAVDATWSGLRFTRRKR